MVATPPSPHKPTTHRVDAASCGPAHRPLGRRFSARDARPFNLRPPLGPLASRALKAPLALLALLGLLLTGPVLAPSAAWAQAGAAPADGAPPARKPGKGRKKPRRPPATAATVPVVPRPVVPDPEPLTPRPVKRAPAPPAPPRLELVVVGPGDDDFTLYGHAGIRVIEPSELAADGTAPTGAGRLYNFGITNFRAPGYVHAFATGAVQFWGNAVPFRGDLRRWIETDRTVVRHALNLSPAQTTCVVERMARDVSEAHRNFLYDTFRENCATKLRDVLDDCTGGAVFAALGRAPGAATFRDDVRHAYAGRPLLLLFSDLIPGLHFDLPRSVWSLAYRPEVLASGLATVKLPGAESTRSLLGPPQVEHQRTGPDPRAGKPRRGATFLYVLAFLVLLIAALAPRLPERLRGGMLLVLVQLGAFHGALLWWLAVSTAWPDMRGTALVLYFMPFDLVLLWPAGRALLTGRARAPGLFGTWLTLRITLALVVLVAGRFFAPLGGPISGPLLALAGLLLAAGCLTRRPWPPLWVARALQRSARGTSPG